MGSWISSLLRSTLQGEGFADNDFMGHNDDIVSIPELIEAMAFYATTMGYSPEWEQTQSSTFDNFKRRPGVYKKMLKKIDTWSTLSGGKKLSAVKKVIRIRVSDKIKKICGKPDPLGVFKDDSADMRTIYGDTDLKSIVYSLHMLGKYPEKDPRFYIHMVYRYYMNEFHKQLADDDKVLRYPSIQKIMDITEPIDGVVSIPAEFRTFLKSTKGNAVCTVTVPVPSKTNANEVVYTYNFESAVLWVPVMRAMIFDLFINLNSRGTSDSFREIYPKYLVKGEGGCEQGNKAVVEALARSIEMKDLVQTLQGFQSVSIYTKDLLDQILSIDSRVANIFSRYNNHPFLGEGEQLHERLGFLLQDSIRGVFRRISSKMSSFCNDIYTGLRIELKTIGVFQEYCTTKTCMTFKRRDESEWRQFIVDARKICCILHAWSRKSDADQFVKQYRSVDGYLCRILEEL